MSSLPISIIAFIARPAFSRSGFPSSSARPLGTMFQAKPYVSRSQPQRRYSPPSPSRSQSRSTSACVSHVTKSAMPPCGISEPRSRLPSLSAAVERQIILTVERKLDHHDLALVVRPRPVVTADAGDLRVGKARNIEIYRLFCFAVKPKQRRDAVAHGSFVKSLGTRKTGSLASIGCELPRSVITVIARPRASNEIA